MASISWPSSGSGGGGGGSNASVGANLAPIPTSATLVAGENPSLNLQPLQTDASGNLLISAASLPLPTGAATSALQTTGNSALGSILLDLTNGTQLTGLVAGTAAIGSVTVSNFPATQPVSGTVTANQGTAGGSAWPVSAASLPLPTGAATSANQTNATQKTQIVDGSGNVIAATSNALNVSNASDGSVAAGTAATKSSLGGGVFNTALPTLTNTQQAAIQLDSSGRQIIAPLANTSIVKAQLQDNSGTAIVLGQTAMSASVPVAIASNQSTIVTSQTTPAAKTVTQAAITVGTTAVRATVSGSAPSSTRTTLVITPDAASTAKFYIGSSTVLSTGSGRGPQIVAGQVITVNYDNSDLWIVSDTASQTVYILEEA